MGNDEIFLRSPTPLSAPLYVWLLQRILGYLVAMENRVGVPMVEPLLGLVRQEICQCSARDRKGLEGLLDCMEEWYRDPEFRSYFSKTKGKVQ